MEDSIRAGKSQILVVHFIHASFLNFSQEERQLFSGKGFISLAYQVKGFDEVLEVEAQLVDNGLTPVTAAKQVESLKETFTQLQTLFVIVSGFIVVIALIAAADG